MINAAEYRAMASEHHRLAGMCRSSESREQHFRLEKDFLALAASEECLHVLGGASASWPLVARAHRRAPPTARGVRLHSLHGQGLQLISTPEVEMRLTQAAARDLIRCLAMLLSASLFVLIVMPSALAQRGVNGPATENHQSGLSQSAQKRRQVGLIIFPRPAADISHHRHARLRARRERPRRRAAEQRDEIATPHHSITSSASASSLSGTSTPSARAALRLRTSSNLLACMTGRSLGFSPLRMRPTYAPTCS